MDSYLTRMSVVNNPSLLMCHEKLHEEKMSSQNLYYF